MRKPTTGRPRTIVRVPVRRRGRYGIDVPLVPLLLALLGIGLLAAGTFTLTGGGRHSGETVLFLWDILAGLMMVGSAVIYVHTSRRGKFTVWSEVLDGLELRGDERVLDMGCGRGAAFDLVVSSMAIHTTRPVSASRATSASARGGRSPAPAADSHSRNWWLRTSLASPSPN